MVSAASKRGENKPLLLSSVCLPSHSAFSSQTLLSLLYFARSMTCCLAHAVSVSIIPTSHPDLNLHWSFHQLFPPMPLLEVPLLMTKKSLIDPKKYRKKKGEKIENAYREQLEIPAAPS